MARRAWPDRDTMNEEFPRVSVSCAGSSCELPVCTLGRPHPGRWPASPRLARDDDDHNEVTADGSPSPAQRSPTRTPIPTLASESALRGIATCSCYLMRTPNAAPTTCIQARGHPLLHRERVRRRGARALRLKDVSFARFEAVGGGVPRVRRLCAMHDAPASAMDDVSLPLSTAQLRHVWHRSDACSIRVLRVQILVPWYLRPDPGLRVHENEEEARTRTGGMGESTMSGVCGARTRGERHGGGGADGMTRARERTCTGTRGRSTAIARWGEDCGCGMEMGRMRIRVLFCHYMLLRALLPTRLRLPFPTLTSSRAPSAPPPSPLPPLTPLHPAFSPRSRLLPRLRLPSSPPFPYRPSSPYSALLHVFRASLSPLPWSSPGPFLFLLPSPLPFAFHPPGLPPAPTFTPFSPVVARPPLPSFPLACPDPFRYPFRPLPPVDIVTAASTRDTSTSTPA
ncbi:hypothetical protein B0H11DRAFT_262333 [Mycena galericulata]|nr:hypothetical protein B0H11DRAFT_262333 [Mycena galericulata]